MISSDILKLIEMYLKSPCGKSGKLLLNRSSKL
nr:MAG TPA: hypothetical protein [Caudoviricetes sp.]